MKKTLLALAAAASVATLATVAMPTKADARVYVYEGARYCFYFDGWHGPGWYRCGFRLRTGLGWGGAYGWHGWRDAGWERRRHGRHGGDVNVRIRSGERDGVRSRSSSERTTIRSGERSTRENIRSGNRGGAEMRGTTGVNTNRSGGPSMRGNVGASGGANINAAPSGGPSGGASVGGGGGAQRRGGGNQ